MNDLHANTAALDAGLARTRKVLGTIAGYTVPLKYARPLMRQILSPEPCPAWEYSRKPAMPRTVDGRSTPTGTKRHRRRLNRGLGA